MMSIALVAIPTRPCPACRSEQREAIDRALLAGASLRTVSARFSVSLTAAFRHKRDHLPAALVQAHSQRREVHASNLLAEVRYLQARGLRLLDKAEHRGNFQAAAATLRTLAGFSELLDRAAARRNSFDEREQQIAEQSALGVLEIVERRLGNQPALTRRIVSDVHAALIGQDAATSTPPVADEATGIVATLPGAGDDPLARLKALIGRQRAE